MLYEIGARVNNSRDNSKEALSNEEKSDEGKPLHYSQSAHQLGQCETKLLGDLKCDKVEEVDDNNASSNMSPNDQSKQPQTPKRTLRVNRSSLVNQMTYRNQHNFIPQPKLNVQFDKQSDSRFVQKSQSVTRMQADEVSNELPQRFNHRKQSLDSNMDNSRTGGSKSIDLQHSQGEISNIIIEEGMKPEKTIVAQVKKLDSRSKLYK